MVRLRKCFDCFIYSILTTIIVHAESGEWMESSYVMPVAKQNDPQAMGSAITYARRYALASIFNLNQEESDDDGNLASGIKVQSVKEQLTPKHPLFKKAVEHLEKGGNIKDIESKYVITDEARTMLEAIK